SAICGAASPINGRRVSHMRRASSRSEESGAQHGIFRRLRYATRELMLISLLLMMATAFLPFPTKLMAEAIHDTDAVRAALIFCGGALLLCSPLLGLMWGSAARDRQVLRPEVSEKEVTAIALATAPNIGLYVGMMALG